MKSLLGLKIASKRISYLSLLVSLGVFLISAGPTVWAKWQINRFSLQWMQYWTKDTLRLTSGICPAVIDAATRQAMETYLQRAGEHDPLSAVHRGAVACLLGNQQEAERIWHIGSGKQDPISSLFAAITAFAHKQVLETPYAEDLAKYGYKRCTYYDEQKDIPAAIRWCEFSLAYAPRRDAAATLADLYKAQQGAPHSQDAWLLLQKQVDPDSPDYWWAAAKISTLEKDWVAAAQNYQKSAALEENQDAFEALVRAGDMWLRAQQFAQAEKAYHQALALDPTRIEAYLGIGKVYRRQKRFAKATDWFEKAREMDPEHYAPYYHLGLVARARGRYEEALSLFDEALSRKENATVLYYKAVTLDALHRRSEAIQVLSQALEIPTDPPEQWQKLLTKWQRYPDYDRDPDRWWEKGQAAEKEKDWARAASLYHEGAQMAQPPDDYRLLEREALMYRYLKEWDKAISIYEDLIRRYPDRVGAYLGRGEVDRARQQYQEAITWFNRARQIDPTDYRPLYYLGLAAYSQKQYEEALALFDRSLRLDPGKAWVLYYKAVTLDALGKRSEAQTMLERAIAAHPSPPASWITLLTRWQ